MVKKVMTFELKKSGGIDLFLLKTVNKEITGWDSISILVLQPHKSLAYLIRNKANIP